MDKCPRASGDLKNDAEVNSDNDLGLLISAYAM